MIVPKGLSKELRGSNNFEPGDRIFLFGFSRGAYTVRVVASLLHMYGLLPKGNEPVVPYAIRMMNDKERASAGGQQRFALAAQFKQTFSTACAPWFVGVWDTVSSVGWIANPLRVPFSANNSDIAHGRHAIAIDERRAFFRQNLWRPGPPQPGPEDLKQVWFAGVHCDVGGGYPEAESGLSKIALEWMLAEAQACGLGLDKERTALVLGRSGGDYAAPDIKASMHESLRGMWRIAEFMPKRHYNWQTNTTHPHMNLFNRRTMPQGSLVHESARGLGVEYGKRLAAGISYTPSLSLTWSTGAS